MRRRDFIRNIAVGTSVAAFAGSGHRLYAAGPEYNGRLFVQLQVNGGWDVTSLCDPKVNQRGELKINHWADDNDVQEAGNIRYAPFARNRRLFETFYRDMLVINGVDAQTNSHTTGIIHNWSGRNSQGMPTLSALFAAKNAPDIPLSYLNFGGYSDAGGLIRPNRLDDAEALLQLLNPNAMPGELNRDLRPEAEIERVERFQVAALRRKLASPTLTPQQRENISAYLGSIQTREGLKRLVSLMPPVDQLEQPVTLSGELGDSWAKMHMQLTLLSFKAGLVASSDLSLFGYDTHVNHDALHTDLFAHFADAIEYFWNYANELGIADRITLLVGSDFGRTPHYNADNGKDHWPIGSYIVMEQGARWGNRVVGLTDEGHNAIPLNPDTAKPSNRGTNIYPKHVHKAMRRYLGIENFANRSGFAMNVTEEFDFFNPALSS